MSACITTLSIGPHKGLCKYHKAIVRFDGTLQGRGWRLEESGTAPRMRSIRVMWERVWSAMNVCREEHTALSHLCDSRCGS